MIAAMMATVDPGEEVVLLEPFYENYAPDAILSGARPRYVPLRAPDWTFDREELRAAFNARTKAVILCNPNNPTGKVFTRDEMEFVASLCREFDALCFTDEIYEHILYPRADRTVEHISMARLEGMRERTLVVNSMSKTYSVTGWRVGYVIAPPDITSAVRKVQVGAPENAHESWITLRANEKIEVHGQNLEKSSATDRGLQPRNRLRHVDGVDGHAGDVNPPRCGRVAPLGAIYLAGVACVAAMLIYEQSLVRVDDLSQVKRAFDLNGYVGILYRVVLVIALYGPWQR